MNIEEIVMKLIGPVDPVGCTRTDETRLENLKKLTQLTEALVEKIERIAYDNKGSYQASLWAAADHCNKFLSVNLNIQK